MNPDKALWEKGDFTRIAQSMRDSGEGLVQKFGITQGLKVLDLGCSPAHSPHDARDFNAGVFHGKPPPRQDWCTIGQLTCLI
jgi:hypothetical protein